jgi:hypothetical protein
VLALSGATLLAEPPNLDTVKAIGKQADEVGKKDWKELTKQGQDIARKHDLAQVMQTSS